MEYTEAQQDRIEPNTGQAIPYEDYSVAAGGVTTEDEEGDERLAMKHSKPPHHHHQKKQQQRSSRKRSISSSSSDSSRSSSSNSILSSSSSDDDSGSDGGDDARDATVKKKKRKKKTATGEKKKGGGRQQRQQQQKATAEHTTDDGSINKLISVALRSQKKQYKNQIIQSVKSDLMNTLRSRIVQHQQRGKKKNDDEGGTDDVDAATTDTTDNKQYLKRIKQAYRELEEGYDGAPKFNSKQHKKTIGSILSKLGEVNDIQLYRIPHIDKEMGFDKMDIGGGSGGDTKLNKKMLSASPDKTIPEAVYAALKDAYSSCMLYKYFFRRIYPYLTVPYISK